MADSVDRPRPLSVPALSGPGRLGQARSVPVQLGPARPVASLTAEHWPAADAAAPPTPRGLRALSVACGGSEAPLGGKRVTIQFRQLGVCQPGADTASSALVGQ